MHDLDLCSSAHGAVSRCMQYGPYRLSRLAYDLRCDPTAKHRDSVLAAIEHPERMVMLQAEDTGNRSARLRSWFGAGSPSRAKLLKPAFS